MYASLRENNGTVNNASKTQKTECVKLGHTEDYMSGLLCEYFKLLSPMTLIPLTEE
jgi:hypothetical protein